MQILGVVKVGRYFILHRTFFFVNIMCWQKTSGLANQKSPTLTTPKCIKYRKKYLTFAFFAFVRERTTRRFESHGTTDSLAICSSGK